jgi:TonB family protein
MHDLVRSAVKHARWFLLAVLFAALPSIAQTTIPPAPPVAVAPAPEAAPKPAPRPPDVMKGLLAEVYAHNTFAYLPGPYHFRATFETFNASGEPSGSGSIEKFFATQGHMKVITRFRDHTMTAWTAGERRVYTDDGFDGTIMTYLVNDFLLTPLPPPLGIARRDMDTSVIEQQGKTLDCGEYELYVNPTGMPPAPKETYCVARGTHDLVLRQTQYFSIQYEQFEPVLGRSVPRTIVATQIVATQGAGTQGAVVRCRIHVEQVDEQALDEAALTPPADVSPVSPAPERYSLNPKERTPLHKVTPVWPSGVKSSVTGAVSLRFVISRAGTVKDVEVVFAPSPEFAQAAVDAVKQWTYAPIVRRDKPVEVMTSIVLSFGN